MAEISNHGRENAENAIENNLNIPAI